MFQLQSTIFVWIKPDQGLEKIIFKINLNFLRSIKCKVVNTREKSRKFTLNFKLFFIKSTIFKYQNIFALKN